MNKPDAPKAPAGPCQRCGGTGHERWSCKVCWAEPDAEGYVRHGKGCFRYDTENGGGEEYVERDPCPACNGTGLAQPEPTDPEEPRE